MRTETKIIEIYTFEDVQSNEELKSKVLANLSDINTRFDWWAMTFEDAKNIGLEITGFDLYRKSISYGDVLSPSEICANIFRDHGDDCSTYKLAEKFMDEFTPMFAQYLETEEGEDDLIELEEIFFKELRHEYIYILQSELEYLESEEAILEAIEANEYEFTADGKIY